MQSKAKILKFLSEPHLPEAQDLLSYRIQQFASGSPKQEPESKIRQYVTKLNQVVHLSDGKISYPQN